LPQICRRRRRPWCLKFFVAFYRHLLTKILKNVILFKLMDRTQSSPRFQVII
jgi:hypothetical protein